MINKKTKPNIARRILKWTGIILGSIIGLLLIILLLLQTQFAKNIIRKQAVSYLQKKLQTNVAIKNLHINYLYNIEIDGLYLEDKLKQPLVSIQNIEVSYRLLDMLKNKLTLNKIIIDSANINMYNTATASNFNYEFIINAFVDSTAKEVSKDTLQTGTALEWKLDRINLSKIHFLYNNAFYGQYMKFDAAKLELDINAFNPTQQLYDIKSLTTDALTGNVKFKKSVNIAPEDTVATTTKLPLIKAGTIKLLNTVFNYDDEVKPFSINTVAEILNVENGEMNLDSSKLTIQKALISNHTTNVAMLIEPAKKDVPVTAITDSAAKPFTFIIDEIGLKNNNIQYNNNATAYVQKNAMDFNHLLLDDLNAGIHNLSYDGNEYKASVNLLAFKEQSGFALKNLVTNAVYSNQQVRLNDAVLTTNRNVVNADVAINYTSLEDLTKTPANVTVKASFKNSELGLRDVLYFQPALATNQFMKPLLDKKIFINSNISGRLNDLSIPSLTIKQGTTVLQASAKVKGLPDADKLYIDLQLRNFSSTREGLLSLLPKGILPANINLPALFNLSGTYKGDMKNMNTMLRLNTSSGNVSINGNFKNISNKNNAVFDAKIISNNLQLQKILGPAAGLGNASFNVFVKGRGIDMATANIEMEGTINNLQANNYNYKNVQLKGRLNRNIVTGNMVANDPNLKGDFNFSYNLNKQNPSLQLSTNQIFVDLQKLGFAPQFLQIKSRIVADLANANPDDLKGTINLYQLQVADSLNVYPVDTVSVIADKINNISSLQLNAPFINTTITGTYKLTKLATAVQGVLNNYIAKQNTTAPAGDSVNISFTGSVYNHPVLQSFVPGLINFTPFNFNGNINSINNQLQLKAGVLYVKYADMIIDSLNIAVNNAGDSLVYRVGLEQLRSLQFPLNKSIVYGSVKKGIIDWNARLLDVIERERYFVAGTFDNDNNISQLSLKPRLIINKDAWNVNAGNFVKFDNDGLSDANLTLNRGASQLMIVSENGNNGLPVNITFKDFSIANVARIIESDTLIADGFLNGTAQLKSTKPVAFVSDLKVDSLKVYNQTVGNLTINANSSTGNLYNVAVNLSGDSSALNLAGTYATANNGNLNLKLNIPGLNLKAAQPFTRSFFNSMNGNMNGALTITGSPAKPQIRGALNFKQAVLVYKAYNTYAKLPDEKIVFDEQGVLLNDFIITDSLDNELAINGRAFTEDYQKYRFDMRLEAENFLAINKRLNQEQLIYGPAFIDASLTIKGNESLPVIDGSVKLKDSSKVYVVIPAADPAIEDREGVIEFVDKDNPKDSLMLARTKKIDTSRDTQIKGLNLNISAEATPASSLTIYLNEDNGDYLTVKGNATINTNIDPGGRLSITGQYIVSEGEYLLSLNEFIKRKFTIQKGGSITWDGLPTGANVDLTALYNVSTTATQLIGDQQTSVNQNLLRQRFPFEVYLNIKGEMLKPQISFKLDMPEAEQNVLNGLPYTRIKQINTNESELNKQVMGLLVLGNFIAEDPFNSLQGGGLDPEIIARTTAGKILSQQLNNLVGNIVKGVDINFDVQNTQDYSQTNIRNSTTLNVGVSKKLFNDRTIVTIGSSVPVEGSSDGASRIADNINIDYLISRDGRYRFKVYRKNNVDAAIQGQVIETGAGFTLIMDFNHFRELLQRTKKEKQAEKRRN
jgi:translocation and assembly module TamB